MFLFMFGIVICIFIYLFIDEGKICINKEEPKKKIQVDLCFYICLTIQYKYMHHGFLIMPV